MTCTPWPTLAPNGRVVQQPPLALLRTQLPEDRWRDSTPRRVLISSVAPVGLSCPMSGDVARWRRGDDTWGCDERSWRRGGGRPRPKRHAQKLRLPQSLGTLRPGCLHVDVPLCSCEPIPVASVMCRSDEQYCVSAVYRPHRHTSRSARWQCPLVVVHRQSAPSRDGCPINSAAALSRKCEET